MELRVLADVPAAATWSAYTIARRLRHAVDARGRATVAFSGGSTPALMLVDLAAMDLPWSSIDVFQVDERVAPDGDSARNLGLLDVLPVRARQVHAMPVTAKDLRAATRRYASQLPDRFDVVHLGLGDDGHTASWPPGDPVIDSARAVDLSEPYNGFVRMTLTPPAVNGARCRIVLATGSSKRPMVQLWLFGDRALPGDPLPIGRVRRTGTVVVVDTAAAPTAPAAPAATGR